MKMKVLSVISVEYIKQEILHTFYTKIIKIEFNNQLLKLNHEIYE